MALQCEYCGCTARDAYNLKRHHRRCHVGHSFPRPRGKGDWECEQCNFKTAWKRSLRRHCKLMHQWKPKLHGFETLNSRIVANSCVICNLPFVHQRTLVKHYILIHPWEFKTTLEKSTQTDTNRGNLEKASQTDANCVNKTKHIDGKLTKTETKNVRKTMPWTYFNRQ